MCIALLHRESHVRLIPAKFIPLLQTQPLGFDLVHILDVRNCIMRHCHPAFSHVGTNAVLLRSKIILVPVSVHLAAIGRVHVPEFKSVSGDRRSASRLVFPKRESVGLYVVVPGVIQRIGEKFAVDHLLIVAFGRRDVYRNYRSCRIVVVVDVVVGMAVFVVLVILTRVEIVITVNYGIIVTILGIRFESRPLALFQNTQNISCRRSILMLAMIVAVVPPDTIVPPEPNHAPANGKPHTQKPHREIVTIGMKDMVPAPFQLARN